MGPTPKAALLGALLRLQLPPERRGRVPSPAAPKPASPVTALASLPDALQVMPLAGDLTGESLPTYAQRTVRGQCEPCAYVNDEDEVTTPCAAAPGAAAAADL